jgi:hypothetical protein
MNQPAMCTHPVNSGDAQFHRPVSRKLRWFSELDATSADGIFVNSSANGVPRLLAIFII